MRFPPLLRCRRDAQRGEARRFLFSAGIAGRGAKRRCPPDELTELLRQMSGMAANINQIAKAANASGFVRIEDIEHIKTMQQMLWQAVKHL